MYQVCTSMKSFTDPEILHAIREGRDDTVIESLYASLLPRVKKHVLLNGGSLDDAYDVFQDALMVFYKLVIKEKYDSEKYTIGGFLYTISKHLWINLVKKRSNSLNRERKVEKDELEFTILENIIQMERKAALDQVFQSLGEKCLEILTLFFYHRLSLKEISQKLGYASEGTVKVKSHRCRKLLSDKIKGNKYLMDHLRN